MRSLNQKNELLRIVPYRTDEPKDKVVTTRFTQSEKEKIDNIVDSYGTTLTDFVRNAVFFYIRMLENPENKKDSDLILPRGEIEKKKRKVETLKSSLEQIEQKLRLIEKKANSIK